MKTDLTKVRNTQNLQVIALKATPVLKEAGVTHSSLFGSYVRGEEQEDSDIDMLVEVPKGTGLFAFIGLQHKLQAVLGKKVDLVTYRSIHPLLRASILKEQVTIL